MTEIFSLAALRLGLACWLLGCLVGPRAAALSEIVVGAVARLGFPVGASNLAEAPRHEQDLTSPC